MTLHDAYINLIKHCQEKGITYRPDYYRTFIQFGGKDYYVNEDGSPVVRYEFNLNGCAKQIGHHIFHKDRIPVTPGMKNNFIKLLFKYLLFLRCDGVERPELLKLYVVKCMIDKFEFRNKENGEWKEIQPEFEQWEKIIDTLISAVLKKEITEEIKQQFRVESCCVVNKVGHNQYGGVYDKTNDRKLHDMKAGQKDATDKMIKTSYDSSLSIKENAEKIGVSVRKLQEWLKENRKETLKDKINREYDWSVSLRENERRMNISHNSIKKYLVRPVYADRDDIDENDLWILNELNKDSYC